MPETVAPIAAGAERAQLLAGLNDHAAAAQSWDHRKRGAAVEQIVAAFDAMRDRLTAAQPMGALDPAIVERIRTCYEAARARRYLAVNLDMELVLAVLNAVDCQGALPVERRGQ